MAECYENFLFKEDVIDEVKVLAISCESNEKGKECACAIKERKN